LNISIISRKEAQLLLDGNFPENTAVISFYSPAGMKRSDYSPIDYGTVPARLFYVCAPDIDIEALADFGYTYDTYIADAGALAEFILNAEKDGLDIICQCDYGQSRSAACAAAILEHFFRTGISIFADYRYYPNQLVFNRILEALKSVSERISD